MNVLTILLTTLLLTIICYLQLKLHGIKQKEKQMLNILDDIQKGNLKRRLLATSNDVTAEVCYKINEIVKHYENQLIEINATELANRQILTSLSHDVRTPLTTLIGYLDAILDGTAKVEELEQYLQTARAKAHALKDYTDDLFEWFKINSNEKTYHFERTDINELTRNVISDWIMQFEAMDFDYVIDIADTETMVNLDVASYHRILNNLIHNALKHSEGSQINIATHVREENIEIKITDNGKGMSQKDLPHIFERLYRTDEARPIGSSGLGLSIVRQLVEAHDGRISVTSKPYVEVTFLINMTIAK